MTGPTATTGAGTEQTTSAKRTRILRTGRPGTGTAAALVAALYEQHGAMVVAICRRLLRDAVEAEDAAQQTFLSAQRALQNGSRPREPAAWLATIARNECIARTRARTREPVPTDAEPSATSLDAHSEAVRRENVESLRDALGSLPEQQREAILLREMRGLSYDEVATSLALSPAAVESLLFRARKGLQLRLRGAWAALSPVGWVASVRDLSAQIVTGGDPVAGPAAAKAVAIGLGTAVIAGGALVAPSALRHGHHHAPRHATAPAPKVAATTHQAAPALATPAAARYQAAPVERSKPAATVDTAVFRPRVFWSSAVLRTDDGRGSAETRSGEDGHATTIRHMTTTAETTTEREALGSTSGGGGDATSVGGEDARQPSSGAGASPAPRSTDTTSETAPPVATAPAQHETDGSGSVSDHGSGSESEGGD